MALVDTPLKALNYLSILFETHEEAEDALKQVKKLHKEKAYELIEAVIVYRSRKGELKSKHVTTHSGRHIIRGAGKGGKEGTRMCTVLCVRLCTCML
jgi:uncharacterized membrane protein